MPNIPQYPSGISADGLPLDPILQKRCRLAARGYIALCLYYGVIFFLMLNRLPWASLDQVLGDLFDRSGAIVTLLGVVAMNVALAACSWHLFSMRYWLIGFTTAAAWAVAAWFAGILVLSVQAWLSPEAGRVGIWTVFASVIQLLIYAACAWLLFLVFMAYSRQRRQAINQTTEPLPTTTL
jgi:hypothetical protein